MRHHVASALYSRHTELQNGRVNIPTLVQGCIPKGFNVDELVQAQNPDRRQSLIQRLNERQLTYEEKSQGIFLVARPEIDDGVTTSRGNFMTQVYAELVSKTRSVRTTI